jgi:hypothetical protein
MLQSYLGDYRYMLKHESGHRAYFDVWQAKFSNQREKHVRNTPLLCHWILIYIESLTVRSFVPTKLQTEMMLLYRQGNPAT